MNKNPKDINSMKQCSETLRKQQYTYTCSFTTFLTKASRKKKRKKGFYTFNYYKTKATIKPLCDMNQFRNFGLVCQIRNLIKLN